MSLNRNRIFFPNMMSKTPKSTNDQGGFKPAMIVQRKPDALEVLRPNTSIDVSLNSIMATVQQNQRTAKPKIMAAPSIPQVIADIKEQPQPSASVKKVSSILKNPLVPNVPEYLTKKSPAQPGSSQGNRPVVKTICKGNVCRRDNFQSKNKFKTVRTLAGSSNRVICLGSMKGKQSIPQVKATLAQKCQQRMRRVVTRQTSNGYPQQQRMKELIRKKRFLEDMLVAHQKLQRDRQSIAVEIHTMRNYLNDIRDRLDFSLKKLSSKRTMVDQYPKMRRSIVMPKKVAIPFADSGDIAAPSIIRNVANKNVSK